MLAPVKTRNSLTLSLRMSGAPHPEQVDRGERGTAGEDAPSGMRRRDPGLFRGTRARNWSRANDAVLAHAVVRQHSVCAECRVLVAGQSRIRPRRDRFSGVARKPGPGRKRPGMTAERSMARAAR